MKANEKFERNAEIIEALYRMPASRVAREFGISRERVRQIIYANGGYKAGMLRFGQEVFLDSEDD